MPEPNFAQSTLDLFRAGKLGEAIDACQQRVKQHPSDVEARHLLGQLLCFAGEYDRADTHFGTLASQMPESEKSRPVMTSMYSSPFKSQNS